MTASVPTLAEFVALRDRVLQQEETIGWLCDVAINQARRVHDRRPPYHRRDFDVVTGERPASDPLKLRA